MNFDVFISFKSTDSSMAEELYNALQSNKINTFFSKISINENGEDQYATMINNALEQAKVFIAVGTSIENLNSRWVKYEIQCFNGEMLNGNKSNDCAMFSYVTKNVPPNLLPMELRLCQSFFSLPMLVSSVCKRLGVPEIVTPNGLSQKNTIPEIKKGIVVEERYEILAEIGRGGTSSVYLAWDIRLNKHWAIKQLLYSDNGFEYQKQCFASELLLHNRLNHPAFPRIIDLIDKENLFLIVMDYCPGKTLHSLISENNPLGESEVIRYAKELCDILTYLHKRNIIYRDIKPSNLIVSEDDTLHLIDFGIAREYSPEKTDDTICFGTRGYAAPEQYGGMGQTDARTDIYGLGVTIYSLCTGKNPAEPPYEMLPVRNINKNLSYGLQYIIEKCTQNNPDNRYQNAQDLKKDLEKIDTISSSMKRKMFIRDIVADRAAKKEAKLKKEKLTQDAYPQKINTNNPATIFPTVETSNDTTTLL